MRPVPRIALSARAISLIAALAMIVVALPPLLSQTAQPVAAQIGGECVGWTSGGQTYTTRRMQYTSNGVLHLIGCDETFTLTQILTGIQNNSIVGNEPANALERVGAPADKVWMLNVTVEIEEGAALNLIGGSSGDVNLLRLKSGAAGIISIKALNSTLLIQNTRITSWDPTTGANDFTDVCAGGGNNDEDLTPGECGIKPRSYISARSDLAAGRATNAPSACNVNGGGRDYYEARMDIVNSQVDHLGYFGAEAYGLSWKVLGRDPSISPPNSREIYNRVDVFGNITNSTFTENFFGGYTFGAYCMDVTGNDYSGNYYYGFDPHDDSDFITVSGNTFNNNGGHGFICSVYCDNLILSDNVANGNGKNGLMIHRRVDGAVIEGNTASNNGDSGLAIFDSYGAEVRNNTFANNGTAAIRFSVGASDNLIENNTLSRGSGPGNGHLLYSFTGSDIPTQGGSNRLRDNTIRGNTMTTSRGPIVMFSDADGNVFEENSITVNGNLTTFEFPNGQDNVVRGNTVSSSPRVVTYLDGGQDTARTILQDLTIGQSVVIQNESGAASTVLEDSRSHVWSGIATTASPSGTRATSTSATQSVTTLDFTVDPASSSVEVDVLNWSTSAPFAKSWTEDPAGNPGMVAHTVGNLQANSCYEVLADDEPVGSFLATGSGANGRISFGFSDYPGSGAITFEVNATTGVCDQSTATATATATTSATATATATVVPGDPAIALNKESSKYNGIVTATLGGFAPNSDVTLRWPRPYEKSSGVFTDEMVTGTTDDDGDLTVVFRTPLEPLGDYTITATDEDGNDATTVLRVIPRVLFNEYSGPAGMQVRIFFYGFDPGNQVEVKWYEGSSFEVLTTVTIASNGRGSRLFNVPQGASLGDHLIRGDVIGVSRSATDTFTVVEGAEIALDKDKSKYNGVVTATLGGFAPNSDVTLRWPRAYEKSPDNFTDELVTGETDGSGNATLTFRTPLVSLGDYTITGTDGNGGVGTTTLRVIPRVLLNEYSGPAGAEIRIFFYGFAPGNQVEVKWYEGSSFEVLTTVTIADNGRGSRLITVPEDASLGDHLIRGDVIGVSRSATDTFEVTASAFSAEDATTVTATATAEATDSTATATAAVEDGSPVATEEPALESTATPTDEPVVTPAETATSEPTATEDPGPTPHQVAQTSRSSTTDPGTLAVDEDPATVWQSSAGVDPGQMVVLTLDYGDTVTIGQVRMLPGPDGLLGTATIETSNDGESWTFFAQPNPAAVDEEGWLAVGAGEGDPLADPDVLTGPMGARYVRVVFVSDGSTIALGGIAEIESWPPGPIE